MDQLLLAFVTGLTTGGISCFAVQGGLLASALTENHKKRSTFIFLGAKLFAYTLLGFLLGMFGANLSLSPKIQGVFQILIGVFMILTTARILNIHPIFKNFVITPPKSVFRLLKNNKAPFFLGLLTVLIPCGVTQAMMLYAIGTGSGLLGAGIMFAFVAGTSPIFLIAGLASSELLKHKFFNYIAAFLILLIGIISIGSGLTLLGLTGSVPVNQTTGSEVIININNNGYKSNVNTLKIGVPVKLTLKTQNVSNCTRVFTIPDLNYFKVLPETGTEVVEFTPTKLGNLTYTCSMGMYSGQFTVIE